MKMGRKRERIRMPAAKGRFGGGGEIPSGTCNMEKVFGISGIDDCFRYSADTGRVDRTWK